MLVKIEELLSNVLKEREIIIEDIEYVKEDNTYYLRVFIDQKNGIDLNTIVEVTPIISDLLDEYDIIKDEYILEVSSPGAEKKLKNREDLLNSIDEYVYVELINPQKDLEDVVGYLKSFDDDILKIEYFVKGARKKIEIAYENVKLARLAIKF